MESSAGNPLNALRDRLVAGGVVGTPPDYAGGVLGLVMEYWLQKTCITLVALMDGTASLYFSTGGGVIGGEQHEAVRAAAREMCELASAQLAAFTTSDSQRPARGNARMFALLPGRVEMVDVAESELVAASSSLTPLFVAGQEVISQLRIASGFDRA